jgi:anti-sigma B factor antagonist
MQSIVEQRENVVILTLKNDRVEGDVSAQLKAKLLILAQPDIEALIVDMTAVSSIDSSGIGAFLLANRQLKDHDVPVVLCGVNNFIRSLMKITRIDSQFVFSDSIDDVLENNFE